MFDTPTTTEGLRALVLAMARLRDAADDAERIERIRLLEELKAAAAAAQAVLTSDFVASQRAAQAAAGVPGRDTGRGVAAQVALAKRESPARARRYVGWARILTGELPHTMAALAAGRTTEWRAQLVARETAWLSPVHRAEVDAEIAPRLEALGDRQVEAEVKKAAYRRDPHGYLTRLRTAEEERRVTLRPAPDTMAVLTGLLPVATGVAVYAALKGHADTLRATGDARSRGQIMADTLVERVTGQASGTPVPVQVNVVMTDRTLLNLRDDPGDERDVAGATSQGRAGAAGADEPADVIGYGPVPAEAARRLAGDAAQAGLLWLRRFYTHPADGQLVAMESRGREFPPALAHFLLVRDRTCRTPWCDAPVRHHDHVVPDALGGATSASNGQGLCEACNQAKEAPGWHARPGPDGAGGAVRITTPTGHTYASRPPDVPGAPAPGAPGAPGAPPPAPVTADPRPSGEEAAA